MKAQPRWLSLSRELRQRHWKDVSAIIRDYLGSVTFTYYDADAFHGEHSDIVICTTQDILRYHHMWDRIKDTPIFCEGFYHITDVRMGIEGVSHETA